MTEFVPFVQSADVKVGDILITDGGFTCIQEGYECEVKSHKGELYFECEAGKHFLDGQLGDDDEYVGLWKKEIGDPMILREE